MKYYQIIKCGKEYILVRYNANGTMTPPSETDRHKTYFHALYWAHKWNKIVSRGLS